VRTKDPNLKWNSTFALVRKKLKSKGAEQNFSRAIFRIIKVIKRIHVPVYEREDLNKTPIEGQFYQEKLIAVRITKQTVYKIHKILDKRVWMWHSRISPSLARIRGRSQK